MTTMAIKSDAHIETDVRKELHWDPTVRDADIAVRVTDGIVMLGGCVSSYPRKIAARDAAHRVDGVLDVVDEIKVRIPTSWERPDEEIAKAVRMALKWDVLVPDDRIASTVSSGVVTLQGTVDTWSQRDDAERSIERLVGVRSVLNQICVVSQPVNGPEIKRQIEEALARHAQREGRRIGVAVRDGVVTLTGTVRYWGEKNLIERVAAYAPGIRKVEDRTTVDPNA